MSDVRAVNRGMQVQFAIYGSGNRRSAADGGDGPDARWPVSPDEWRELAQRAVGERTWAYLEGGAGGEETVRANREALERRRLVPRALRDVSQRDISVEILGRRIPAPFGLAPVGVQEIFHPDGDLASARAAAAAGVPFVLSTVSSRTMEEVALAMGDAPRWFQLYPAKSPDVLLSMLERARRSGFEALVVTVDTTMPGWRERDLRLGYLPFLEGKGLANYLSDPAFRAMLPRPPEEDLLTAVGVFMGVYINPAFTWRDLDVVREHWQGPLWIKGVLDPEDALLARDHGADGVIVSNHGGRQVDGAVGALDALERVAQATKGALPLLMDGGVRRGSDVLRALALGARAVLIGRLFLYGLAAAGEAGVRRVLDNLAGDLDFTLGLCGLRSIEEVDRSLLSTRG